MRMRRIGVTGMLVFALATLAGSATATATTLNHRLDQQLANRLTLHLSDMPTGWRVEPPSKSSTSCKGIKSVKSDSTAKAEADFSMNPDVAYSVAGVLSTLAISKRAYTNFANDLRGCLLSLKLSGAKDITVGAMSFPHFGNQSKAWRLQATIQGINVYFDIILVRVQRAIAIYLFGGIGSGDSSQEVSLVRKATARA